MELYHNPRHPLMLRPDAANALDRICRDVRSAAWDGQIGKYHYGEYAKRIDWKELEERIEAEVTARLGMSDWWANLAFLFSSKAECVRYVMERLRTEHELMEVPTYACVRLVCFDAASGRDTKATSWSTGHTHDTLQTIRDSYADFVNYLKEAPGTWQEKFPQLESLWNAWMETI